MSNLAIKQSACTINVPFHGNDLYVVNHNGEPYTPMKPIVEGMGMDWKSQHVKLTQRFAKGMVEITIPTAGGIQKMICLALRKLAAWLNTISPNKVKPEIRDRVIQYQEECDDVLYEYWTKGQATNPRKTSTDERTPLRDAINMLVGKRGIMYPEAYSYVHQRFNVGHIDELPAQQLPVVIEYVHRLALEGEFLGKQEVLPALTPRQFTDEELCTLANLWRSAAVMYEACKDVYPLLLAADHRLVPRFCSIGANFNRGINKARVLLKRETGHIKEHPWGDSNWKNTLTYDMKDF
ncbi:phage antirepressor Ant [Citrobacter freundii]|uniref:Phage antirepressor Ant n=3 Tax=Citrobacter freundii TaxID=546 RepID=A0AAN4D360_CITFR|nr:MULTISPECIES: phage antirepressor N-terminal domain-containing protein [Citrobacter freundii complex]ASG44075.1 phage antirepressor Ant [Citrobacter freundii]EKV4650759.1 phage antirepressor Ant [Citrobacter freundii]EKW7212209.1 phage antirepressor Ant [Citrobacter freundii]ELO0987230.1 phage antirepressor Ant [Citrobacter freundii]ELV3682138.1 phage antirepressor Ant [Citrobacter freundii]